MIIISDTSPLSSLALVGYLSILKDIYTNVIIPQAVANELANLTEEDIRIKATLSLEWIQVQQATNLELVACLRNEYNLDIGEAAKQIFASVINFMRRFCKLQMN